MHAYIAHLSKNKKLKKAIDEQGEKKLSKSKDATLFLWYSIMSQQLSTKVAAVIRKRFLELYGNKTPTAADVAATLNETLRAIGLSNAKVSYVKNVAEFALANDMSTKKFRKMSDEEVVEYLLPIKGVGRWTVEMLLIFGLGREDVFAPDDLGIQNFFVTHFKLDSSDKKKFREDMLRLSAKWTPYRSFACLHMWNYKEK